MAAGRVAVAVVVEKSVCRSSTADNCNPEKPLVLLELLLFVVLLLLVVVVLLLWLLVVLPTVLTERTTL